VSLFKSFTEDAVRVETLTRTYGSCEVIAGPFELSPILLDSRFMACTFFAASTVFLHEAASARSNDPHKFLEFA